MYETAPLKEARRPPEHKSVSKLIAEGSGGEPCSICVRVCDGAFFPVSYISAQSRADSLGGVCQSLCPNADVVLYSMPFGGTIDQAVSVTGEPYARLPNAHKFEQSFDATCSCRAQGQSWAEALAAAEAKYGSHSHDIFVTAADVERTSRPVEDPKQKPAKMDSGQPGEQPPPGLDQRRRHDPERRDRPD
jgi:hypothetical protein